MDRHIEKTMWLGVFLQAFTLLISGVLNLAAGVDAIRLPIPFTVAGLLVCLMAAWRERLSRRAAEEQRDLAVAGSADSESLFATDTEADAPFSAAQQADQFERLIIPWTNPLLLLIGASGAAWLTATARGLAGPPPGPLAAGFLGAAAFAIFLNHRVLLAVSRHPDVSHTVKPAAIRLGLTALTSAFSAAIVMADAWAGTRLTATGLYAGALLCALLALESLVMTATHFYRSAPQRRRLSGSRLGALLCDPATWAHDIAGVLDYQFGFRISETWIFRALRRMIVPLLGVQLALLYLSHCLVILSPGENAIIDVLGRPNPDRILQPGIHWVLPPPWHRVRRYPVERLQSINVGFDDHADHLNHDAIELWTEDHHDDEHDFLLAARDRAPSRPRSPTDHGVSVPVDLLSISLSVDYHVTDLVSYLTIHRDPDELLRQAAARLLLIEAIHADLFDLLGSGQSKLTHQIAGRLQTQADQLQLGVTIRQVNLRGVHPPVPVAAAFEAVIGADEYHESALQEGAAYRIRHLPAAHAESYGQRQAALAYRDSRRIQSDAEAVLFRQRVLTAATAPDVYAIRSLMDVLERRLAHSTRHLIAAPATAEVIQIDLSEKPYSALLDAAGRTDVREP